MPKGYTLETTNVRNKSKWRTILEAVNQLTVSGCHTSSGSAEAQIKRIPACRSGLAGDFV